MDAPHISNYFKSAIGALPIILHCCTPLTQGDGDTARDRVRRHAATQPRGQGGQDRVARSISGSPLQWR